MPDYDRVQLLLMMPKFYPRSYVDLRAHRRLAAAAPDQVRQATYVITHCTYKPAELVCVCAYCKFMYLDREMWQQVSRLGC